MVSLPPELEKELRKEGSLYPGSDGKPIADNTKQLRWIVTIYTGLAGMFRDDPNVFVAADLLWYPVGLHQLRQRFQLRHAGGVRTQVLLAIPHGVEQAIVARVRYG